MVSTSQQQWAAIGVAAVRKLSFVDSFVASYAAAIAARDYDHAHTKIGLTDIRWKPAVAAYLAEVAWEDFVRSEEALARAAAEQD